MHKKPLPVAGLAEKLPVSSYRRIETNDLWSWTTKNNGWICAHSGAGTQTDTEDAAWKMERKCVPRVAIKALSFPDLQLLPGSRKLLPTQSQCALVNTSHKTRTITLSFTPPLLLAHSANHLLSVVLSSSAPTEWGNSVIPTDRLSYGTTRNSIPTFKLLCFHHKRILHHHHSHRII